MGVLVSVDILALPAILASADDLVVSADPLASADILPSSASADILTSADDSFRQQDSLDWWAFLRPRMILATTL